MRWVISLLILVAPAGASAQRLVDPPADLTEVSRDVDVTLRHGLALVTTRVTLRSVAATALEAKVRVRVPADAGLAGLRVCAGERCRRGVPARVGGVYETARRGRNRSRAPVAVATIRSWDHALEVEAAPIHAEAPFVVTVRYVAPAETSAGVTTFTLPPQGGRPEDGPVRVRASARGLDEVRVDGRTGPVVVSAFESTAIRARVPEGVARASAWSLRCGAHRCARFRVVAGPVAPPARDVFLLLDASPSASPADPALRARALGALLDGLSPSARVTRIAYARRARRLDDAPRPPADVPRDAALPSLGNRTSVAAAWDLVAEATRAARAPLIVLVGDGAIAREPRERAALDAMVDAGAEVSLLSLVEDRYVAAALTDAVRRSLGVSTIVLTDEHLPRAARLAAPIVAAPMQIDGEEQPPLRAGDERVIERRLDGGGAVPRLRAFGRAVQPQPPRQLWNDGFAARMSPADPRATLVAATPSQIEAASEGREATWGAGLGHRFLPRVARVIRCRWCGGCRVVGAVSREALGRARARLRPAVRACFRDARAGRPAWSARATLRLRVQYGELLSATVPHSTDPALAECLAHVADEYADFPVAPGVVEVNFPFLSEADEAAAPEALRPSVAGALEAAGF